jgi:dephospho-CoA kinase
MGLIGITGAVGAGKSTVLGFFAELGCAIWDADEAVHRVYRAGGAVLQAMVQRWGQDAIQADGSVNRPVVSARIFAADAERHWLEALVHPLVDQDMHTCYEKTNGLLVCAVPLLYEARWEERFSRVVTVWCSAATRRERLRFRGWTAEEIAGRDRSQLSADEKLRRADFAIITEGPPVFARRQCAQLWPRLSSSREMRPCRVKEPSECQN